MQKSKNKDVNNFKVRQEAFELVEKLFKEIFYQDELQVHYHRAKKLGMIFVNEKIAILAILQEDFGEDNIKIIREITKQIKHLIRVKKAIEKL
jgi:hypothetical protein